MRISWVRLVTTDTMTSDAYREFCWGVHLPEVPTGYGLILGYTDDGQVVTAVLADVDYARLLAQARDVLVPEEKITMLLFDWPDLNPTAASVWS
ncbi:hypothetical protein ABZ348_30380 [Streptomyces sp. NPDC005963]|uniref:hypothetical protein n=1 Tax=Streptomyces sp. NPDC005963 TaxID=3156721 RepID=UPI0033DE518F